MHGGLIIADMRCSRAAAVLTLLYGSLLTCEARAQIVVSYLYIIQGGQMYEVDEQDGGYRPVGTSTTWSGATSFASDSGRLGYVIQADALWQVSLGAPGYTKLSNGWPGPTELTYGLTPHNGTWHRHLFAVQGNELWRVELPSGATTSINRDNWAGSTSMAILDWDGGDEQLFVIDDDALWRVNVNTGGYTLLGNIGDWAGETSMTGFAGRLYVVQDRHLWRVEPSNGAYTDLGGSWNTTTAMTDIDKLYIVNNNSLYSADIVTGNRQLRGSAGAWGGPVLMASRFESF